MSQCPRCHQPLPENARFCGNCGYRVPDPGEGVAAPAPEPVAGAPAPCPEGAPRSGAGDPAVVAPAFAGRSAAAARASRKGRTGRILALVLGSAAVVAVVCGAFLFAQDSKAKEPHPIAVGVANSTTSQGVDAGTAQSAWGIQVRTASGAAYDDGATSIPVKVDGTVDGASYETVSYLDAEGAGLALPVGDFTLTFPAGAILSDGTFVAPADDTQVTVTVEDTDQGPHATFSQDVTFTEVPASQVTDDDLDAVARYAQDDANDQGKAQNLCQNVRDARDSQASTAQAAKKAYAGWLTQYAVPWGDSGKTVPTSSLTFCLVDANNDGVPDLMIESDQTAHVDGYMELLTYVDGDVKLVSVAERFTVYSSGYVLSSYMGVGNHEGAYFNFEGSTIKQHAAYAGEDEDIYEVEHGSTEPLHRGTDVGNDYLDNSGLDICVTDVSVDDKAVDWDTYDAAVKAITQEEVPLSLVDNTAANRTSVLLNG
ncbi:zinc ribbon domain-containing protein [Hugonella massiliensis]|uniref:zinc ribbon domain-containing protein n=1 Tax=Hugonella massiliensis TaxID=1720315 RepID=UPI00073F5D39|nr:zinc ribbon domain-containing protein [Hugonella massiliensis]